MSTRVKLNSAGVAEVLRSVETRSTLTERAESVLAEAQLSAPVVSGEYRASLHIEQATTDRAAVRVVASASHAGVVEAKHGTLGKAMKAAGR